MKSVTRRTFMMSTAVAATAAASTFAASPNEQIRLGVIGCGSMGRGDWSMFDRIRDVATPIICDVDDGQSARLVKTLEGKKGMTPEVVRDYRRVIDRKDIDICLIATPDHWHALPTIQACEAGKDVYVEKPFANSIAESRAMVTAAKKHNRVVQMGSQWRSAPHIVDAVNFVKSGKIGEVRSARAWQYSPKRADSPDFVPAQEPVDSADYDMWLGPAEKKAYNKNRFHRSWRYFWDYGGGNISDNGVHLIGVCLWPMGNEAPIRVSSSGGKYSYDDNTETPDTQIATFTFPSYTLVWEHGQNSSIPFQGASLGMEWRGTKGMVVADDYGWRATPEAGRGDFEPEDHKPGKDNPRDYHGRNFLDCVEKRTQPTYNPDEAHYATTVAHLGNLSYRSNSEVRWDANKELPIDNPAAAKLIRPDYRKPWVLPTS
jgi:predicted dehydrogenase